MFSARMGLGQGGEEWGWSTVCKIYDVRKLTHWYKIQDLYTFICALYEYFYLMLRCTIFSDVYMKYSTMQSLKTRRSSSTDNCTTYVRRYFLRIDFVPSHVICLVHFIRKKKKTGSNLSSEQIQSIVFLLEISFYSYV